MDIISTFTLNVSIGQIYIIEKKMFAVCSALFVYMYCIKQYATSVTQKREQKLTKFAVFVIKSLNH